MCFFDQYQYECGDFKWGNFRQHCAKEYRTGETCGIKLVMQTIAAPEGGKCKLCTKINTKLNRIHKEQERIRRWQKEGGKHRRASIENSEDAICQLEQEVNDLWAQKEANRMCLR